MSNYQAYENGANLILRPILAESVNTKREYQSWMSFLYFVLSNCHWRGKIEPQEELDYRNIEVLTTQRVTSVQSPTNQTREYSPNCSSIINSFDWSSDQAFAVKLSITLRSIAVVWIYYRWDNIIEVRTQWHSNHEIMFFFIVIVSCSIMEKVLDLTEVFNYQWFILLSVAFCYFIKIIE